MALIREKEIIDHSKFNYDSFMRNKDAPFFYDDPITGRDIKSGAEVVSRGSNMMPKVVSRDKLGDDALLTPMNIALTASEVIQVVTGYEKSLNDYLYVLRISGTAGYLYRFNTLEMLSPYGDSVVTLPAGEKYLGLTVLNDKIGVLYQTTDGGHLKMRFYDFDLNYLSEIIAPNLFYDDGTNSGLGAEFTGRVTFNGVDFVQMLDDATKIRIKQHGGINEINASVNPNHYQTFTSPPILKGNNIKKIGVKVHNNNPAQTSFTIKILDNANNLIVESSPITVPASTTGWYYAVFNTGLTNNTVYRIRLNGDVYWVYDSNSSAYGQGDLYDNSGFVIGDACFQIVMIDTSWNTVMFTEPHLARFTISNFEWLSDVSFPVGTTNKYYNQLLAYDKKFYYRFNKNAAILQKIILGGTITLAAAQTHLEDIKGILFWNNYIYVVYTFGTGIVAVPISA